MWSIVVWWTQVHLELCMSPWRSMSVETLTFSTKMWLLNFHSTYKFTLRHKKTTWVGKSKQKTLTFLWENRPSLFGVFSVMGTRNHQAHSFFSVMGTRNHRRNSPSLCRHPFENLVQDAPRTSRKTEVGLPSLCRETWGSRAPWYVRIILGIQPVWINYKQTYS